MSKTVVLIPAYNEDSRISPVVETACRFVNKVVVVDDGSADNTCEQAQAKGAFCIRHNTNKGKGASLQTGFQYILDTDAGAVIVMDGDGQHDANELPAFLELFKKGEYGIILGNRMLNPKGMPLIRWLTNKVMSAIISRLCKQKVPDSQCGYRLISRKVLEQVKCGSLNYEWDSEILIKAGRAGFKIGSVPVKSIYNGQESKINSFTDTIRFFKLLLRLK